MTGIELLGLLRSISELEQNSSKLLHDLFGGEDARIDQVSSQLLSEKKRTEYWVNYIRVSNSTDLRPTVASKEFEEVRDLKRKIELHYNRVQNAFAATERTKLSFVSSNFVDVNTKIRTVPYDDLRNVTRALKTMNDVLMTIANPPPTSSDYGLPEINLVRSQRFMKGKTSLLKDDGSLVSTAVNEDLPPGPNPTTTPIQLVYDVALKGLLTISIRRAQITLTRAYCRLKLWGAGLFDLSISLDDILASDEESFADVRDCILYILVVILVREGWSTLRLTHHNVLR